MNDEGPFPGDRRIYRLLEPYNRRWSGFHDCWIGRAGRDHPWMIFYRWTDPRKGPQHCRWLQDKCEMEVVDGPHNNDPIDIYTRDRISEWRERLRDHRRTGDRGVIRITEAA